MENNFGEYGCNDIDHRCSSLTASATQHWFGAKYDLKFFLGSFSSLEKETQPTKYDSEKLIRRDLFDMFKVTFFYY